MSRHGLACLESRPEFGVATQPGHGRGPGVSTLPLVSRPAMWACAPSARSSARQQHQRVRHDKGAERRQGSVHATQRTA